MPGSSELLHPFFERAAQRHPGRIAVEVPPGTGRPLRQSVSYAELDAQATSLAARLRALVSGECIVAILLPRDSQRIYAAQLGVLKAGAAYTCLDPGFPDEHCRFILGDTRAVALLTDRAGRDRAGRIVSHETEVLAVEDLLEHLRDGGREGPPEPLAPPAWLGPESLAYIIYTSGTTGRPKGVMIEHRSIANLVASDLDRYGLTPADRAAQSSSAAYDSSIEEIWLAFAAGATLVVMDDETARLGPDLVPWLQRERITVLCPTPTMLRTTGCADPRAALPELRFVYTGGEEMPDDLTSRWAPGRRLENGYGPTECTVVVVRTDLRADEPVAIGRPIRGHRAWVLDEGLEEVAEGQPGELCVGGIGLARGYLDRPALTAQSFPTHPRLGRIYRTGDLVRRDPDGMLFYLGRIDSQVKLRGYRIELGAIEVHLARCPGVREAACRVQGDGASRALAAFVVPADTAAPPDLEVLRSSLRAALPEYMVPTRLAVLDRLPTTVGGKLDRSALPELAAPEGADSRECIAPRNELETRIAACFTAALTLRAVPSIDSDFFLDLGGDSLAAAALISDLRAEPSTASLTVRDLYEARTVIHMAERAHESAPAGDAAATAANRPRGNPILAGAFQGIWLTAGLVLVAPLIYAVAFLLLPLLVTGLGILPFLLLAPLLVAAATLLWVPLAIGLAALAKRILIGRYRPLRAPVWGSFYVRNWMVQQVVRLIPWGLLQGTVFASTALRALGARVGKRVHIHRGVILQLGGWDLLEIGDDATLCQDSALRLVDLHDGQLVVGPISIGAGSTIDVRAGVSAHSAVGERAFLGALAWLPSGESIPAGERWEGVPAGPAGPAPPPGETPPEDHSLSPTGHGVLLLAARFALAAALSAPFFLLAAVLAIGFDVQADEAIEWLFSSSSALAVLGPLLLVVTTALPVSLLLQALALRAMGPILPGVVGRWSPAYLRIWLKSGVLQSASRWLSGTLFWPRWLRLAKMKVGPKCEISTIIDTPPECVEIGAESFFADGIYLAGPEVHRGTVTVATTQLGRNTFLGNHAVIRAGQQLPDDILIGVCTIADDRQIRPGSSWFGHPPFELPRREVVDCDRRLTHDPGPLRYLTRLSWELARFLLPIPPALALLAWFKILAAVEGTVGTGTFLLVHVPALSLAMGTLFCLIVLGLKWSLLGRVRPGQHPLWSCWCSRWDFLYVAWNLYARGPLTTLEGTPYLPWYLRAMGARVGRRVVLGGAFAQVVDPDMLAFEDDATVNCMFQAHSFEDRVLKIGRVHIGRGATASSAAVLFYGADVGERTWIAPHGVVMKRERLLPGVRYAGCPTRPL